MHPGMMYWWKARQAGGDGCGASAGCGPGGGEARGYGGWRHGGNEERHAGHGGDGDDFGGGAFGVRRPLRFLAYKLELDEAFDETKAKDGADLRVGSAQRLRDAVTKALGRIHGLLDTEQREQLAYLIRTGTLQL